MDLTKWLPLWSKCPELKPVGLYWRDAAPSITCCPRQPGRKEKVRIDDTVAAALIRDRAVWWLAEKCGQDSCVGNLRLSTKDDRTYIHPRMLSNVEIMGPGDYVSEYANDPIEAVYVACCRVLEIEPIA